MRLSFIFVLYRTRLTSDANCHHQPWQPLRAAERASSVGRRGHTENPSETMLAKARKCGAR